MFTGIGRDPPPAPPGDLVLHHRSATTTTASTGTSTSTAPSSSRSRPPASCSPRPTRATATRTPPRSRPGSARRSTSTCSRARLDMTVDGHANAVEEVDASRVPMGPDNPCGNAFTQQRTHADAASPRRSAIADSLVGRVWHIINPDEPQPARASPSATRCIPRASRRCWPTRPVLDRRARRVRHQAPVGHPVRPGRALPGRRLRQPAPGRRRAARVRRAATATIDGEDIVRVAHLRPHALPAPGGLAGHAGRLRRVHAQAGRLLRPQPHAGRAAATPAPTASSRSAGSDAPEDGCCHG